MAFDYDAIIIGSGPNGLAAAITLAHRGLRTIVLEAASETGGGTTTRELTLPGFRHDVCSSIYPLVSVSPFFRSLADAGVFPELIKPEIAMAHVVSSGEVVAIRENIDTTTNGLGEDGDRYRALIEPFLKSSEGFFDAILSPPLQFRHSLLKLRLGLRGLRSAESLANKWFSREGTRGMFAGMAAHSILPLDRWLTGAVGMMFCVAAHATGWPLVRGGAASLSNQLVAHFRSLGGEIQTDFLVKSLAELPTSRTVLFDTSPSALAEIASEALPSSYRKRLQRFRHGPGVCKVDWALAGPIPWNSAVCRRAGTVHLGGTMTEIKKSEEEVWNGRLPETPFLLVTQPSLFDETRTPQGRHVAWAYCHVPAGSSADLSVLIEERIESVAPGFRERIIGKHVLSAARLNASNPNYIGGDIGGGVMDLRQFIARPVLRCDPYSTPNPRLFMGSASTPPGPGVHGMCGMNAARSILRRVFSV